MIAKTANEAVKPADEAKRQLANANYQSFSPQAHDMLQGKSSEHFQLLRDLSEKFARRDQADVVSATHVEQASRRLAITPTRHWARHVGAFGILFLGAAITNFYTMITSNHYTGSGVSISAAFAIAGAVAYTYQVIRD